LLCLVGSGGPGALGRFLAWMGRASTTLIGAGATLIATLFAMYVTWTSVGARAVDGLQFRYFFPALLVLPLVFAGAQAAPDDRPAPGALALRRLVAGAAVAVLALVFCGLFARLHLTFWARYW
jgi:hypothetical protein